MSGKPMGAWMLAARWVFNVHGTGPAMTVGTRTRRLLAEAFVAGYRAGKRAATEKKGRET